MKVARPDMPDVPVPARTVEWWQARLDQSFPQGVIASWIQRSRRDTQVIHHVPLMRVVGVAGGLPEVFLPSMGWQPLGPWQVLSYQVQPRGLVRVTFDNISQAMLWCPHIPPLLAEAMAHWREHATVE